MSRLPMLALVCLGALASPVAAQQATDAGAADGTSAAAGPAEAGGVSASLALEALGPTLDEDGQPVVDAEGQPVLAFQSVADGTGLIPGDEFRYVASFANTGAEVRDIEVALDLPVESRLLADTVEAPAGSDVEVGSSADPALKAPLFVEVDGALVPNPDWAAAPEKYDQLLVAIERIGAGETATVTYHLVVR